MISIIIPSNSCPYAFKTVNEVLTKAKGEIEVIVNVDSPGQEESIDPRVTYLHPDKPLGMRGGINAGLKLAKGDYIMKIDDHCLFSEGYDKVLAKDMQDNWLVIPRRYSLHADNWDRDLRMPVKDYHLLSFPSFPNNKYGNGIYPQEWVERMRERLGKPEYDIDDTMSFQGSCYFANRKYFMDHVGFLDDRPDTYSTFSGEPLEVGLKYWLGGGEVKVNKKTWYAHLFKNRHYYHGKRADRDYKLNLKAKAGHVWSSHHWMRNEEPNMIHPMSWLVEKFWPVPGWPEDRSLWTL